jgi:hypothetical protein
MNLYSTQMLFCSSIFNYIPDYSEEVKKVNDDKLGK